MYQPDGTTLITIGDADEKDTEGRYLLVPEGVEVPACLEKDIVVLQQPLESIYLAASSAMDFFRAAGRLDQIRFTSTKAGDWSMEEVKKALEDGDMLYAGKYSAPDYELLLSQNTDIAIESTMIYHSPETKEQLERLGIPVLVERSSYEDDPLGRLEWIKLYGLLGGWEEEAEAFYDRETESLEEMLADAGNTGAAGRTAAFFYISSNGYAVVRRNGDYAAKMIEMAGGTYIPRNIPGSDESALSTLNMEMERFYEEARDVDVIFYNSSIDGEITTMRELVSKSGLLQNFRAVKEGEVWCTGKNLFQQVTCMAGMIREMNMILSGSAEGEELEFFSKVSQE